VFSAAIFSLKAKGTFFLYVKYIRVDRQFKL
jgi:hypothetical protein